MKNRVLRGFCRTFVLVLGGGVVFLTLGGAAKADAVTNVYYSVGQNTADHKTTAYHEPDSPPVPLTVTISKGRATFSVAQTALNMGVGDRVTYNTSLTAYISGKKSQTEWILVTSTGGIPADVTGATVDSIRHEFNSLANAVSGASDFTHLNTRNLSNGNYVLNIPCYYDSGPDTAAVDIVGYTTGKDNYINIYTPYNLATEVNRSQRHTGRWTANAYRLEVSASDKSSAPSKLGVLVGEVPDLRIDGLQIYMNYSVDYHAIVNLGYVRGNDFRVTNNILKSNTKNESTHNKGINADAGSYGSFRAFNNVIYDICTKDSYGILTKGTSYVFNNTISNVYCGIIAWSGSNTIASNNIITSSTYACQGTFAKGTGNNATSKDSMGYVVVGSGKTNDWMSRSFSFRDAANGDFHLSPTDTGARNHGINLSADADFALHTEIGPQMADIDHQKRPAGAIWDIGADQLVPFRIAYHDGAWGDGPIKDEHWAAFTHNIHHYVRPKINSDSTEVDLDVNVGNVSRDAAEMVRTAHENGQPILIGVASPEDMPKATDSTHLNSFADALIGLIAGYGYDGIEVDWEGSIIPEQYENLISALRTRLDVYPAPIGGKGLLASFFGPVELAKDNHDKLDFINVSCYDNFDWTPLDLVWHNNALYDPGNNGGGHSCQLMMRNFADNGIPQAKLGVGISFYGYLWASGSDDHGNGPFFPGQVLTTSSKGLSQKWYRNILKDPLFIPANQKRDVDAGNVPYLSVKTGGSKNIFLTYDDADSITEKYKFMMNNKYGGVCVWTQDSDYISTGTTASQRHPLAEAIRAAAQ